MKKFGIMLLCAVFAVAVFSCNDKKGEDRKESVKIETEEKEDVDEVEKMISLTNKLCPKDMGEGLTLTKANYDGEVAEFVVQIDETIYSIENFRKTGIENLKSSALAAMTPEVVESDPVLKAIVENGKVLRYTYFDSADNSFSFDINAEEFE